MKCISMICKSESSIFGINSRHHSMNTQFSYAITIALWGFLDLKSELIRKGETQNQGKNGQI